MQILTKSTQNNSICLNFGKIATLSLTGGNPLHVNVELDSLYARKIEET
jgi:hypothetical protein